MTDLIHNTIPETVPIKHLNITLRHLRTFVVVARHGSFNNAAKELSRTQPAVTLAIKQLEEFIGLKLLDRSTRKVSPTAGGEHFLPVAQRLIRDFDTVIRDLSATAERRIGHVSMAVLPSIATQLLLTIIKKFSSRYPGISVHLSDDSERVVQQRLIRNEVDIGIGVLWQASHELEFTPLLEDKYELICHKDHPLARESRPVTWQSLAGENILDWGVHQGKKLQEIAGRPKLECHTMITLLAMLKANLGIAVLPSLVIPRNDTNFVSRILIEPEETREICLITRKDWTMSPASEAMIEILLANIPRLIDEMKLQSITSKLGPSPFRPGKLQQ